MPWLLAIERKRFKMRESNTQSHRTLLCVFPNFNTKSLQIWDGMGRRKIIEGFPSVWFEVTHRKHGEISTKMDEKPDGSRARVAGSPNPFLFFLRFSLSPPFLLSSTLIRLRSLSLLFRFGSQSWSSSSFLIAQLCPILPFLLFSSDPYTHSQNYKNNKLNKII